MDARRKIWVQLKPKKYSTQEDNSPQREKNDPQK